MSELLQKITFAEIELQFGKYHFIWLKYDYGLLSRKATWKGYLLRNFQENLSIWEFAKQYGYWIKTEDCCIWESQIEGNSRNRRAKLNIRNFQQNINTFLVLFKDEIFKIIEFWQFLWKHSDLIITPSGMENWITIGVGVLLHISSIQTCI